MSNRSRSYLSFFFRRRARSERARTYEFRIRNLPIHPRLGIWAYRGMRQHGNARVAASASASLRRVGPAPLRAIGRNREQQGCGVLVRSSAHDRERRDACRDTGGQDAASPAPERPEPMGLDLTEAGFAIVEGDGPFGYSIRLSPEYSVVLATACAFVVGNMDKINISVAIIPMAKEFHWSPTVIGLVQSSFFYGYLLSQLPAGYASSRFGGKNVLSVGVGLWSLSTACIPFAASTIPGLFLSRAAVGLGEGVAPAAATDLIAKTVPTSSRSRATSFVFGGLHVGSLLGLTLAPFFIDAFGWPSVF